MTDKPTEETKRATDSASLSADFLLAEFNTLQNRASVLESNKSNRVNFMLILAAGVMAGIGPIISIPALQPYQGSIILFVAIAILLLGIFTLQQNIDDSVSIVVLFRRAGRVRLWFVEQDKRICDYVAFHYGDDHPKMNVPYIVSRGGEAVILLLNTVAACVIVLDLLPTTKWLTVIEVVATALVAFLLQNFLIHRALIKAEKKTAGAIKFPYSKITDKLRKP